MGGDSLTELLKYLEWGELFPELGLAASLFGFRAAGTGGGVRGSCDLGVDVGAITLVLGGWGVGFRGILRLVILDQFGHKVPVHSLPRPGVNDLSHLTDVFHIFRGVHVKGVCFS